MTQQKIKSIDKHDKEMEISRHSFQTLFSDTGHASSVDHMTTKISVGNHDSAEPRCIRSLDESFTLHWSWS